MVCEKPTIDRCPPMGSRGRGPWSGRGSQRVKPRLVSPFEKRRLFFKGQKFLRVVDPKAKFCPPRRLRFRVGDPSNRPFGLRRDDNREGRRNSGVRAGTGSGAGIPWWKGPCPTLKKSYDDKRVSKPSSWAVGAARPVDGMRKHQRLPPAPHGVQGPRPLVGKGSQRVKPRLVSPFEKRRLFCKGQKFLRVVCAKADSLPARWQRFRTHDFPARSARSG